MSAIVCTNFKKKLNDLKYHRIYLIQLFINLSIVCIRLLVYLILYTSPKYVPAQQKLLYLSCLLKV